jgi:hypothetical protein
MNSLSLQLIASTLADALTGQTHRLMGTVKHKEPLTAALMYTP